MSIDIPGLELEDSVGPGNCRRALRNITGLPPAMLRNAVSAVDETDLELAGSVKN